MIINSIMSELKNVVPVGIVLLLASCQSRIERQGAPKSDVPHLTDENRIKEETPSFAGGVSPMGLEESLANQLQDAFLKKDRAAFMAALRAGANPNLALPLPGKWGKELGFVGKTPAIVLAAQDEDPWFLERLLEHGGNPGAMAEGKYGSALNRAFWAEKIGNAQLLLDKGLPLDAKDGEGNAPLDIAIGNARYDFARELLRRGALPANGKNAGSDLRKRVCMDTFLSEERMSERSAFIEDLRLRGVELECSKASERTK